MVKRVILVLVVASFFLGAMPWGPGSEGGTAYAARRSSTEKYVVYKEEDYYGNETLRMGTEKEYRDQRDATKRIRVKGWHLKALAAAKKAWYADPEHKGIRFPIKGLKSPSCVQKKRFRDAEDAGEYLDKLQTRLTKKKERAEKRREKKLRSMSPAAREKMERHAELVKEAKDLFEEKLNELLDKVKERQK